MYPHQDLVGAVYVAERERHMLLTVVRGLKGVASEATPTRGHLGGGDQPDLGLASALRVPLRTAKQAAKATYASAMRFGVMMQTTDRSMSPIELAQEAEARGYACIYLPEHTHIPTSRRTPPPTGEEELSETYFRTLDPYIALAACAQATTTVGLGVGSGATGPARPHCVRQAVRHPRLDERRPSRAGRGLRLESRGRWRTHGIDVKRRRALVREHMLWRPGAVGTRDRRVPRGVHPHGALVELAQAAPATPHPHHHRRRPRTHDPSPTLPSSATAGCQSAVPECGPPWANLGEAMEAVGRSLGELELITYGTHPDPGKLAYYQDLGITEVVLRFPPMAAQPTRWCRYSTTTPAGLRNSRPT